MTPKVKRDLASDEESVSTSLMSSAILMDDDISLGEDTDGSQSVLVSGDGTARTK